MKFYTGIGSRNTPANILELMEDIAFKLAEKGWTLRSGGAKGADSAFEKGVIKYCNSVLDEYPNSSHSNIYIPWDSFRDSDENNQDTTLCIKRKFIIKRAEEIASEIHPNWKACSRGAKALHSRNVFQVLGHWDIDYPSKFVICWAPIVGTTVSGGTRTAVELAKSRGIEVFNMADKKQLDRVVKLLDD